MAAEFLAAVVDGNFSGTVKVLDAAIKEASAAAPPPSTLASLYVNRGFCNQRLQLYRKALKVWHARTQCIGHAGVPGSCHWRGRGAWLA